MQPPMQPPLQPPLRPLVPPRARPLRSGAGGRGDSCPGLDGSARRIVPVTGATAAPAVLAVPAVPAFAAASACQRNLPSPTNPTLPNLPTHNRRAAPPGRVRQAGVAVITALVVVVAATVAVSTLLWRQSVAMRKVENQAAVGQSRWLARGAIDWLRIILREDARISQVDHPGEIWAVPLAETRVGSNGIALAANADDPATAVVSGRVTDAQARFNLANLVLPAAAGVGTITTTRSGALGAAETMAAAAGVTGVRSPGSAGAASSPGTAETDAALADELAARQRQTGAAGQRDAASANLSEIAALTRLLGITGQPGAAASRIARIMAARMNAQPRPLDLDDFAPQIDAAVLDSLRPYVVVLPRATPVNLNTASAEVLAARFENLPLERARALVESRQRAWFVQVSDALNRLPGLVLLAPQNSVAVATSYFQVEGAVRQGRVELNVRANLERGSGGATRIFDWREL